MEDYTAPDMEAAARHLDEAKTSILEGLRALRNDDRAQDLKEVAKQMGMKAEHFRAKRLLAGLKEPSIGPRAAARAMGKIPSQTKLDKLALARGKLAEKRREKRGQKDRRIIVAKHTAGLEKLADLAAAAVKRASSGASDKPLPAPVIPEPTVIPVIPPPDAAKPKPFVIEEV